MAIYKIADVIVEMDIRFDRLKNQAEQYLYKGNKKADITLVLEEKVMERARKEFPKLDDGSLEYLLFGALFYDKLLDYDGMMLHASAVSVENRAYLFSANSGVGKSTHTTFWTQLIRGARIINDDKPALRFIDGDIYVYGTPFSGKHDISINGRFLLGGICFLERGKENIIKDISPKDAIPLILPQTASMHSAERISKKLEVIDRLLTNSRLYKMQCTNDISAAKVSYEKMRATVPVALKNILPVIDEMLYSGGKVTFTTNGASMQPILKSGDSVTLIKANEYKKGDVVLFRKEDGKFILHRIIRIRGNEVLTQGDSLSSIDEPIDKSKILGKAIAFIGENKTVYENEPSYKLYKLIYMSCLGRKLRLLRRKIIFFIKRKA